MMKSVDQHKILFKMKERKAYVERVIKVLTDPSNKDIEIGYDVMFHAYVGGGGPEPTSLNYDTVMPSDMVVEMMHWEVDFLAEEIKRLTDLICSGDSNIVKLETRH